MNSSPNPKSAPYFLFFRNTGADTLKHLSAEERQQLIQAWNRWYDDLAAAGKATAGQPLEESTRVVAGPGGNKIIDGPFPESKEAIGGYVILHVDSLDEATQHAQNHPGLEHGMKIEIRQMGSQCHLGVRARDAR